MKTSAKTQILTLVLAVFGAVLVCIICARMEQAGVARAEAEGTGEAPEIHPPVPETPGIARAGAEAPRPESGEVVGERELVLQDFVEFVNLESENDDAELEMLACVIYTEAGGDDCSDLCRQMVGDVALNRIEDSRFPGTLEGVLTQEGQYGEWFRRLQLPPLTFYIKTSKRWSCRSRKRFIKLLMSEGISRNGAVWLADFVRKMMPYDFNRELKQIYDPGGPLPPLNDHEGVMELSVFSPEHGRDHPISFIRLPTSELRLERLLERGGISPRSDLSIGVACIGCDLRQLPEDFDHTSL